MKRIPIKDTVKFIGQEVKIYGWVNPPKFFMKS